MAARKKKSDAKSPAYELPDTDTVHGAPQGTTRGVGPSPRGLPESLEAAVSMSGTTSRDVDTTRAAGGIAVGGGAAAPLSASRGPAETASAPRVPLAAAPSDEGAGPGADAVADGPPDPIDSPTLFRKRDAKAAMTAYADAATSYLVYDREDVKSILAARQELDKLLPPRNIAEMNLEEELILQYYLAKQLARDAAGDANTPRNQQAQVMNSCAAILKTLAEVQTALYTAERVKAVEQAIERAFVGQPDEVKRAFFERYSRLLREIIESKDAKNQAFSGENTVKMAGI